MLTKKQIIEIAKREKAHIGVIERDYVQALLLREIYAATDTLLFKGGTALKFAHNLGRYSEDLDFTALKGFELPMLEKASSGTKAFGINGELKMEKFKELGYAGRFKFEGPGYIEHQTQSSKGSIYIDISLRSDVVLPGEWRTVSTIYPDVPPFQVFVMKIEEIASEKIRALQSRSKARDAFDLYMLLARKVEIDAGLIKKKLKLYNEELDVEKIALNLEKTETAWEKELGIFTSRPPQFTLVKAEILKAIQLLAAK